MLPVCDLLNTIYVRIMRMYYEYNISTSVLSIEQVSDCGGGVANELWTDEKWIIKYVWR